jgi:hypothetical protein
MQGLILEVNRSAELWQLVGLKGNRLQKHLAGSYIAAFSAIE